MGKNKHVGMTLEKKLDVALSLQGQLCNFLF